MVADALSHIPEQRELVAMSMSLCNNLEEIRKELAKDIFSRHHTVTIACSRLSSSLFMGFDGLAL